MLSSNFDNTGLSELFTAHKEGHFLNVNSHLKTYANKDYFNYLKTRQHERDFASSSYNQQN
jgi:hypothetical protein